MSKIGIGAALLIGGTAAAAAGTLAKKRLADKQRREQEQANREWERFQRAQQERFAQQDEEDRRRATDALTSYLDTAGGPERTADVQRRSEVLDASFNTGTPDAPTAVSDTLFEGQKSNANIVQDAATRIAKATSEARDRIKALATASSYGQHMQGDAFNLLGAQEQITEINDARNGNVNALNRYAQIQPEVIGVEETGLADFMIQAGSMAAGHGTGMVFPAAAPAAAAGTNLGAIRPKPRPDNLRLL